MGPPAALNVAPPVALTIAGSDSGGGAGIQADLACFLALGVHGASAVTAVSSQSPRGISGIHEVAAAFVGEQIRHVCADVAVAAAKTGMLASAATIREVAAAVTACGVPPIRNDPPLGFPTGTPPPSLQGQAGPVPQLLPPPPGGAPHPR